MSKLPNNIVFCLTEAPLYQPHLRRFFFINLGDVFSYQSLRLGGQCMLLMGKIPAFCFLHRVFLHLISPFRGWQVHQLLVKLPVLLCISVLTFFTEKMCFEVVSSVPLKAKLRVSVIQKRRAYTNSIVLKEKDPSQVGQLAGSPGFLGKPPPPLHETAVKICELPKPKVR